MELPVTFERVICQYSLIRIGERVPLSRAFRVMVCALLAVSVLALGFRPQIGKPQTATIIVPTDYPTIQEAINGASGGDTIYVLNGEYRENVVVNKTVSLIGESESATIIDGRGVGTVVHVVANNVTVRGFTIQHGSSGFHYDYGYSGIQLYHSSGGNISHNIIRYNYVGIFLQASGNNALTENSAYGNTYDFAAKGDRLAHFTNYVDTSNTVNGKPIYYLVGESSKTYGPESNAGAVYLINCENITLRGLTLSRNYYGAFLWNTRGSKVEEVSAFDNYRSGVFLERSSGIRISDCAMSGHLWHGVGLVDSYGNELAGNSIAGNWNEGIYSYDSDNNRILSNIITDGMRGIYLDKSNNTLISGNTVAHAYTGATIYSAYCTFSNNTVKENSEGMVMSTSHNVVYHNNFIRNGRQVLLVNQYANTWDNGYPSGGNYWSDYTGSDSNWGPNQNLTGSDGIGDTHYVIGANNRDRYPLMNPYTIPDIAVAKIAVSKTVAERGCVLSIVVTLENQANKVEFSSVTLYINAVAFASRTVMLAGGRTAVTFEWNTTSCAVGTYTIAALATPVRNEEDTADNGLTYGSIVVSIAGDVDGDLNVDVVDIVGITCIYGYRMSNAHFNANSDLDEDGIIGIFDVVKCVGHYGQKCP